MTSNSNPRNAGTINDTFYLNDKVLVRSDNAVEVHKFDLPTATVGDLEYIKVKGVSIDDGDGVNDDDVLVADLGLDTNFLIGRKNIFNLLDTVLAGIAGGRLSTSATDPVADSSYSEELWYHPYTSGQLALRDLDLGCWKVLSITDPVSINIAGLSGGDQVDVFAYKDGTNIAFELSSPWTDPVTRSEALLRYDGGVFVKDGDISRRYIGTIRCYGGDGAIRDDQEVRGVWNMNNRVRRKLGYITPINSWNYDTGTWRAWNDDDSHVVRVLSGFPLDTIDLHGSINVRGGFQQGAVIGIGYDDTATNAADIMQSAYFLADTFSNLNCHLVKQAELGWHSFYAIEKFQGDAGTPNIEFDGTDPYDTRKAGILGTCWA